MTPYLKEVYLLYNNYIRIAADFMVTNPQIITCRQYDYANKKQDLKKIRILGFFIMYLNQCTYMYV